MRRFEKSLTIHLFKWSVFSLIIPACGIFIRWLVSFAETGPEGVGLAEMFRQSEVPFLAATMLAETVGDAPDIGEDNPDVNWLIAARALLSAFLVLSLTVFGALVPLTAATTWLSERGQGFHALLNTVILTFAILTCLAARWIYWICDSDRKQDRHQRGNSPMETEHSQTELEEEHE